MIQSTTITTGIICYECMMGRRPYNGRSRREIRNQILSKQAVIKQEHVPRGWSASSVNFINALIQRKPYKRLGINGIEEIKQHEWFKGFDWEKMGNKQIKPSFIPNIKNVFDYLRNLTEDYSQSESMMENSGVVRRKSFQDLFKNYDILPKTVNNSKELSSQREPDKKSEKIEKRGEEASTRNSTKQTTQTQNQFNATLNMSKKQKVSRIEIKPKSRNSVLEKMAAHNRSKLKSVKKKTPQPLYQSQRAPQQKEIGPQTAKAQIEEGKLCFEKSRIYPDPPQSKDLKVSASCRSQLKNRKTAKRERIVDESQRNRQSRRSLNASRNSAKRKQAQREKSIKKEQLKASAKSRRSQKKSGSKKKKQKKVEECWKKYKINAQRKSRKDSSIRRSSKKNRKFSSLGSKQDSRAMDVSIRAGSKPKFGNDFPKHNNKANKLSQDLNGYLSLNSRNFSDNRAINQSILQSKKSNRLRHSGRGTLVGSHYYLSPNFERRRSRHSNLMKSVNYSRLTNARRAKHNSFSRQSVRRAGERSRDRGPESICLGPEAIKRSDMKESLRKASFNGSFFEKLKKFGRKKLQKRLPQGSSRHLSIYLSHGSNAYRPSHLKWKPPATNNVMQNSKQRSLSKRKSRGEAFREMDAFEKLKQNPSRGSGFLKKGSGRQERQEIADPMNSTSKVDAMAVRLNKENKAVARPVYYNIGTASKKRRREAQRRALGEVSRNRSRSRFLLE